MSLKDMIAQSSTPIEEIGRYLDALDEPVRLREIYALGKRDQELLFEKARPEECTLEHFVPPLTKPLSEVIHYGKNTLPAFTQFQKRFTKPLGGAGDQLFGYNEGSTRGLIGPGYFVAYRTEGRPEWEAIGGVVIDYFKVPEGQQVPEGWPKVVPNSRGLQMFVYNKTRDFMRQVSGHVTIGAAYRGEKPMGAYFVLCRQFMTPSPTGNA
jgi:hypothetical protein